MKNCSCGFLLKYLRINNAIVMYNVNEFVQFDWSYFLFIAFQWFYLFEKSNSMFMYVYAGDCCKTWENPATNNIISLTFQNIIRSFCTYVFLCHDFYDFFGSFIALTASFDLQNYYLTILTIIKSFNINGDSTFDYPMLGSCWLWLTFLQHIIDRNFYVITN